MRIKILRAIFCPFFEEMDHFLQRFLFVYKKKQPRRPARLFFCAFNFQFLCSGDCDSCILHDAKKPLDSSKRNDERKIPSIVHYVVNYTENTFCVVDAHKCCIDRITCHIVPLSASNPECVQKKSTAQQTIFLHPELYHRLHRKYVGWRKGISKRKAEEKRREKFPAPSQPYSERLSQIALSASKTSSPITLNQNGVRIKSGRTSSPNILSIPASST